MVFDSFAWVSVSAHIVLQLLVFARLREPKSLRYLMLFLTLGNVAAILSHNHPALYWDALWIGRGIALVWLLWALADVIGMPVRRNWPMAFPVLTNAALFLWYWPFSAETTPAQLDTYRSLGYGLALLILAVGIALAKHVGPLQFGLLVYLLMECSGAATAFLFGVEPRLQLIASTVGMLALSAAVISRIPSNGAQAGPPSSPRAQFGHS